MLPRPLLAHKTIFSVQSCNRDVDKMAKSSVANLDAWKAWAQDELSHPAKRSGRRLSAG